MAPSKWMCLFAAGLLCAGPAPASAADNSDLVRRDSRAGRFAQVQYRKKWAVIVGIDYAEHLRKASDGPIRSLKNAENDARALYELLTSNFGYTKDETVLLTGTEATKRAIERRLTNDLFGDKEQVGKDDSVLFFFSGH